LLRWANGNLLLLWFGDLPTTSAGKLQNTARISGVHMVQVVGKVQQISAVEAVHDATGALAAACGAQQWALIRPDSYLAATGQTANAQLIKAIATALALP
jgi:3-(3-hydroxy-phenyl)propionate hydroxylase